MMTEEERLELIKYKLTVGLCRSWYVSGVLYDIVSHEITGTVESGGANAMVEKDGGIAVAVPFTNAELYGEGTTSTRVEMESSIQEALA